MVIARKKITAEKLRIFGNKSKATGNSLGAIATSSVIPSFPASADKAFSESVSSTGKLVRRIFTREDVIETPFEKVALNVDTLPQNDDSHEMRHRRSIAKMLDGKVEALQERWDDENRFDVDNNRFVVEANDEDEISALLEGHFQSNSVPVPEALIIKHQPPSPSPDYRTANNSVQEHPYLDYIYSAADDVFIHKRIGHTIAPRAFERMFKSILPCKNIDELLTRVEFNDNIYAGLRLVPGAGVTVEIDGLRLFNIYRGLNFAPTKGDTLPFDMFVEHLFQGVTPNAEIFLDCLAWICQNPSKRLNYLLVFFSPEMENTVILSYVIELLNGKSNAVYVDSAMLGYSHNDWLLSAKLIIIQRLSSSRPAMEKVGSLINSPQQWINPKRSDQYPIQSVANVTGFIQKIDTLSAYPHPSQIALLPINDQALSALSTTEFRDWLDSNGKAYVLEALLARDVSHFTPLSPPLELLLSNQQSAMTLSPLEDYLREALDADIAPMACELVNINRLVDYLNNEKMLRTNATEVRNALNNMGAVNIGQKRIDGKKPNIWALHNHEYWKAANESVIASTYVDPFVQNQQNEEEEEPTSTSMSTSMSVDVNDVPQPQILYLDDL